MFIFGNCLFVVLLYCDCCLLCYLRFVCVIISVASGLGWNDCSSLWGCCSCCYFVWFGCVAMLFVLVGLGVLWFLWFGVFDLAGFVIVLSMVFMVYFSCVYFRFYWLFSYFTEFVVVYFVFYCVGVVMLVYYNFVWF